MTRSRTGFRPPLAHRSVAVMHAVWVLSPHNLHCPRCGRRLVQQAGVASSSRPESPVHVIEGTTPACPNGHRLPERDELHAHRERLGYAPTAPLSQVPPPRR